MQKLGIDKTMEVFQDLALLAISGIKIAKNLSGGIKIGAILGSISELAALGKAVTELVKDIPGALPELADIDAMESSRIGAAAYDLVKKIVVEIKG